MEGKSKAKHIVEKCFSGNKCIVDSGSAVDRRNTMGEQKCSDNNDNRVDDVLSAPSTKYKKRRKNV